MSIWPLTNPLTHELTNPLTNSRTHELTNSRTHELTNSPTHELTNSRTHELTNSRTHELTNSRTHELTNSRTHELDPACSPSVVETTPTPSSFGRPLFISLIHYFCYFFLSFFSLLRRATTFPEACRALSFCVVAACLLLLFQLFCLLLRSFLLASVKKIKKNNKTKTKQKTKNKKKKALPHPSALAASN